MVPPGVSSLRSGTKEAGSARDGARQAGMPPRSMGAGGLSFVGAQLGGAVCNSWIGNHRGPCCIWKAEGQGFMALGLGALWLHCQGWVALYLSVGCRSGVSVASQVTM